MRGNMRGIPDSSIMRWTPGNFGHGEILGPTWNKGSFFLTQFDAEPKSPPPNELLPLIPMANAQVILKEKIEGLGAEADVVKVRAGYARNFLIPQGKAFEANRSNLRHVEALKASRAAREAEELVGLQELAVKISKLKP